MTTRILGIESSCDETAAAVVADGREILSNVVASQVDVHRKYGGVVPELASREHLRHIVPVVREALERAGMRLADVDAIGVTRGPGLVGALLVGLTYGKVLAQALGKPLVAVNHLEGHVHAVLLEAYRANTRPEFPAVCLIVSGGHTLLYRVEAAPAGAADSGALDLRYRRLGGTRDDAAGEAYDKVAQLLALGYPGGPIVDQLASLQRSLDDGDRPTPRAPRHPGGPQFATPKLRGSAFDFSFSGIKTAVLYHVRDHPEFAPEIAARRASWWRNFNSPWCAILSRGPWPQRKNPARGRCSCPEAWRRIASCAAFSTPPPRLPRAPCRFSFRAARFPRTTPR